MVKAIFLHQGMTVDIEINIAIKNSNKTIGPRFAPVPIEHIVDYFESENFKDVFLTNGKKHVPYPFLKGAIGVDLTKWLKQFPVHVFRKVAVTRLANPGIIEIDITYYE